MSKTEKSLKPFLFDLYLNPSLLLLGLYQVVITGIFTAQQLLLAAYLDELGLILISGFILAIFFVFWFLFGPICGTLSDNYGRKFFLISGNLISSAGFIGLTFAKNPIILFLINGILGIGAVLRVGSILALWVQYSPKNRLGEAMAYINILIALGGIGGSILGLLSWNIINELIFFIFGIILLFSVIPIFFLEDLGNYKHFSINSIKSNIKMIIEEKTNKFFFFSRPIIQLGIHWTAFSTIIAFSTFVIPIFKRVNQQLSPNINIPIPLMMLIISGLIFSTLGGLIIWGRISDKWARKPVLILGFIGMGMLILLIFGAIQFELLQPFLIGLITGNFVSLIALSVIFILIFASISLIPTPMSWIIDNIEKNDVGKAMSLRQTLIGLGTIIGTLFGGFIIGYLGLNGLLLSILFLLVVSAIILL